MSHYRYLLDIEDHFYMTEHPFNVKVIKVRRLCEEIVEMEEQLEELRSELTKAVAEMKGTPMKRRIRRVRKE